MAATFDRALPRLLREAGCTFVRTGKGSHEIWQNPITGRRFPVPVGIVSRHTANAVPRQGWSTEGFLMR
jgi:predicted RNA binding protein YcfA (HicA-like mRNA interferase family)